MLRRRKTDARLTHKRCTSEAWMSDKRAEKGRAAARLTAARLYNRCFILFTSEYHAS